MKLQNSIALTAANPERLPMLRRSATRCEFCPKCEIQEVGANEDKGGVGQLAILGMHSLSALTGSDVKGLTALK